MPDKWKGISQFCLPLAIVPGPEKECPMKPIFRTIFADFKALGPEGAKEAGDIN